MSGEKILYQASDREVVVCHISAEFPEDRFVTEHEITIYTSLQLKMFRRLYLVATSYTPSPPNSRSRFTAPIGAAVRVVYTAKNREERHKYQEFFEGEVENLIPADLTGYDPVEIEAEIMNQYGARPSNYAPVRTLYFILVKKRDSFIQVPESEAQTQLEELIKLQEQLTQLRLKLQLEQMKGQVVEL
ncbi:MAG: hypothetical protein QXZ11_03265 [Thermoproteota archaeon]